MSWRHEAWHGGGGAQGRGMRAGMCKAAPRGCDGRKRLQVQRMAAHLQHAGPSTSAAGHSRGTGQQLDSPLPSQSNHTTALNCSTAQPVNHTTAQGCNSPSTPCEKGSRAEWTYDAAVHSASELAKNTLATIAPACRPELEGRYLTVREGRTTLALPTRSRTVPSLTHTLQPGSKMLAAAAVHEQAVAGHGNNRQRQHTV